MLGPHFEKGQEGRTGSILVDTDSLAEEYLKAALLMYCYHIVLILRITSLLLIADPQLLRVHRLERFLLSL